MSVCGLESLRQPQEPLSPTCVSTADITRCEWPAGGAGLQNNLCLPTPVTNHLTLPNHHTVYLLGRPKLRARHHPPVPRRRHSGCSRHKSDTLSSLQQPVTLAQCSLSSTLPSRPTCWDSATAAAHSLSGKILPGGMSGRNATRQTSRDTKQVEPAHGSKTNKHIPSRQGHQAGRWCQQRHLHVPATLCRTPYSISHLRVDPLSCWTSSRASSG